MYFFFLILVGLIYLTSCVHKAEPTINDEEMSDLLLDMMLADEVVRLHPPQERDSVRNVLTQSLLKIHDLDRSELDSNLYLYMSDFQSFGRAIELTTTKTQSLQGKAPN